MIKKVSHLKFRLRVAFSQINSGCLHNSSLRLNRHFFLSPWGEELGKFYCIWHINFDCVFVFALTTLNSYILFLHWQRNWHPYGKRASCYACFDFYHDRNQGGAEGRNPLENFSHLLEKCVGHSSKNLGPSQKILRPSCCPKLVTGLLCIVVEWVFWHDTSVFKM